MAMRITPPGNRNWSWWAGLHRHDRTFIDLTAAITAGTSRKSLAEPAGAFTLTLKPSFSPGAQTADLLHEVADDNWIVFGATDPDGVDWIIMVGMVDSIRRSRSGTAGSTSFTIQGRDLGKILVKTDLLDMPWLGADMEALQGNAAVGEDLINGTIPRTPGALVKAILQYCLAGDQRAERRFWAVPQSVVIRPAAGVLPVDLDIRQASDVIALDLIDQKTRGHHVQAVNLPTGIAAGGGLWTFMSQFQNPLLNELYYDVIAAPGPFGGASAYAMEQGDTFNARPSVRLREKPFPTLSVTDDRWGALPVTEVRESDLESYDVGKSGAERFSWFCVDTGGSELLTVGALAMLAGAASLDKMWDAMPAVFQDAVEFHGLARFQQPTLFLPPELDQETLWIGQDWVKLLRDWYAPNPVFLSGTATIATLSPGIRVGERLRVLLADGSAEEFYVEAVDNRFVKHPSGAAHGSTTVSITRGWRLAAGEEYRPAVLQWLRDNLDSMR